MIADNHQPPVRTFDHPQGGDIHFAHASRAARDGSARAADSHRGAVAPLWQAAFMAGPISSYNFIWKIGATVPPADFEDRIRVPYSSGAYAGSVG